MTFASSNFANRDGKPCRVAIVPKCVCELSSVRSKFHEKEQVYVARLSRITMYLSTDAVRIGSASTCAELRNVAGGRRFQQRGDERRTDIGPAAPCKFANGAITGAFECLFNTCMHQKC